MQTLEWVDLATGRADAFDGAEIEVEGWMAPAEIADRHDYFLLTPEPVCCVSCLPTDPTRAIEVYAAEPISARGVLVRLHGRLHRLIDDPAGWRYQLRDAREAPPLPAAVSRREVMAAGALLALAASVPPAPAVAQPTSPAGSDRLAEARGLIAGNLTIDIHSHAGRISSRSNAQVGGVADPMREGGMSVICLAMVADTPVTRVINNRISAVRAPVSGELYAWSQNAITRVRQLVSDEQLVIVTNMASLRAAKAKGPAIIVSSEGADFLEGSVERVEEAYRDRQLRHLQLTHYRVNELGDIQTEPPVHGGLTDFGVEVIHACNRLGIVVDVAHGTYDLVKRAASVTQKPLVLSHTSLSTSRTGYPPPLSRVISADHAKVIAGTGGVIGIWPPVTIFPDKQALAAGIARMVEVVGIDHVGIGSDMLGLLSPSAFASYSELPDLAAALLAQGFAPAEAAKILGGNYARVFEASVG